MKKKIYCKAEIVLQEKARLENFVLQYTGLYCRLGGVVLQRKGLFVLQYKILYCGSRGSGLLDCVATQGRDTASQATTRRWACRWARSRHKGAQARRRGWTRRAQQGRSAGLAAGPVGCALGAFSPFLTRFDSVLFLSQFLDIVREPGS